MLHLSISSGSRLGPYEIIGSLGAGSDVMLTGALAGLASGSNLRLALISWNSVADGAAMTGSWSDQSRLWRRNVQRGAEHHRAGPNPSSTRLFERNNTPGSFNRYNGVVFAVTD